jgi:hypothetical protein
MNPIERGAAMAANSRQATTVRKIANFDIIWAPIILFFI